MDCLNEERLLEVLQKAIANEKQAQQIYAMGASLASIPEVREIFVQLIADEFHHEQLIFARYEELKATFLRIGTVRDQSSMV